MDADGLAEEQRTEDDDEQRLGVVERDCLGQRQARQREKAEPHGGDADQSAHDVAQRASGDESSAQFALPGEEDEDREYGEEGTEEDDLAGRDIASRLDAGRHADENRDGDNL